MTTTFGYISAWAKEPKETPGLKTLLDEYDIPQGLMLSGKMKFKADQAQALIDYLSDPANMGQYGVEIDFALFYDETKTVNISGKITTPYVKPNGNESTTKLQSRRSI